MAYGNGSSAGSLGAAVGLAKTAAAPSRQTYISEQMLVLESRAKDLHQLISEVEARLSPALMPEPPADVPKETRETCPVPLGASLAQINDSLGHLGQRLRSLIDRVEL